jgi:ABC-type oligopeptide transport system substrate-binding subunit
MRNAAFRPFSSVGGRLAVLCLAVALLVTGCGTSASSAPGTPSQSKPSSSGPSSTGSRPLLRLDYFVAEPTLASTLDPAQVSGSTEADTIALVNANLVKILPSGKIAPDLATWSVDSSRKVYTFTIRPNAKFVNGDPVTAADAAYSIRRALAPATVSRVAMTYLGDIQGAAEYNAGHATTLSGVTVVNDRTLRITLDRPIAYFLYTLAYPTADVLDKRVVEGKPASSTNNFLTNNCPGNQGAGPFKFVCHGTGFYPTGETPKYDLVPNPNYYGAKPTVNLELPGVSTIDVAYKMYQAGQLDTSPVPTVYLNKWKGSPQLLTFPTSIVTYLTPNTKAAPFSNTHCRLAAAYAIDRETIANDVLHGASRAFYGVVPEGMLGFIGKSGVPTYDLQKARYEFAQCPYKSTPVTIKYPTGSSDADATYLAVAHMLTQVGFKASAAPIAVHQWLTDVSEPLSASNTTLIRNGWQQDYPDPQDYVTLLLNSSSNYDIGQWKNDTFDRLTNQADVTGNTARRAQMYERAQKIALNDGAWISLTNALGHQVVSPKVHGLVGTSAYGDLVPKDGNWANVSVS